MLLSLSIRNYALISELSVEFPKGLSTITGETGAGKSILMDALGLVLGNRADSSVLRFPDRKCIVEAVFEPTGLSLDPFFERYELDHEPVLTIRREIGKQGKSRAFINDTPVNLPALKELGDQLVDIHAQHQNLLLGSVDFPRMVIDQFGGLAQSVKEYQKQYTEWQELSSELRRKQKRFGEIQAEQEYLQFQFEQLDLAKLKPGEQSELESEQQQLSHAGEIHDSLAQAVYLMSEQEPAVVSQLKEILRSLKEASAYSHDLVDLVARLESAHIELDDLAKEFSSLSEQIDQDPGRLQAVNERLDLIYSLQQKFRVSSVEELIQLREKFSNQLDEIETSDEEIDQMQREVAGLEKRVGLQAGELSQMRGKVVPLLSGEVTKLIRELGMPHGQFNIRITTAEHLTAHGSDEISFFFAANKNQKPEEISRVASGGEISRLMLCVKTLISHTLSIPTLIFDEIDAGVSGEIAHRMGQMIKRIGQGRQVLNITHLPQVAANGETHYLVYKYDDDHTTHTSMKILKGEERVQEMARMLSGDRITDEAIRNAKVLLGTL